MEASVSDLALTDLIQRLRTHVQSGQRINDMGFGAPFDSYPPATSDAVTSAEAQLGFALPLLLRRIYTEVANGGLGPGYGLLGVADGARDDVGNSIVDGYLCSRQHQYEGEPPWIWPEYLLPVCHWGCGIYSCLDCTRIDPAVVLLDPNALDENHAWGDVLYPQMESFQQWITLWADGVDLWQLFYGD
jgi:hypothetical protein